MLYGGWAIHLGWTSHMTLPLTIYDGLILNNNILDSNYALRVTTYLKRFHFWKRLRDYNVLEL